MYPILNEDSDIYPLTLLVDDAMRYGELRLAVPTLDDGDDETENVTIDVPQFEYARWKRKSKKDLGIWFAMIMANGLVMRTW